MFLCVRAPWFHVGGPVTLRKLRILALNGNSLRKLPKRIDLLEDLQVLKVYNQVRQCRLLHGHCVSPPRARLT